MIQTDIHVSFTMRQWFKDRGYQTCCTTGLRGWDDTRPVESFGILEPRPDKVYLGCIHRRQRGILLGILIDGKWRQTTGYVFELYGLVHEQVVCELLADFTGAFDIQVEIRLVDSAIHYEEYWGDGSM